MMESEKLKQMEKESRELSQVARNKDNEYMYLMNQLRKSVQTPLKEEIRQKQAELLELKRNVRKKTQVVYLANPELQRLRKEKTVLWKQLTKKWQDYHNQYELELKKHSGQG